MFWHNFKYSLKTLFRNRTLLFWTFVFPILLGIFFNMAFSDIEKNEQLDIIDVAIVENEEFENNLIFKEIFGKLSSDDNKDKLFDVTYTDLETSKKMLEEDKITGYLLFDKEDVYIYVASSGINETILRNVVDEISSYKKLFDDLLLKKIEEDTIQTTVGNDRENEDNISIADMLVFATGYKINLAVKDSWHHISFDR